MIKVVARVGENGEHAILRMTEEEHLEMFECESTFDDGNLEYLYVNTDENCPYIGVEEKDGHLWVYGARVDRMVEDLEEMIRYLKCT